jgi:hypothetical protein
MKGNLNMSNEIDLEINAQKRYDTFVDRIIENESVWGLKTKNQDGLAVAPSNEYEDTDVMVFWSDKSYAQRCAKEEWIEYEPTSIPLDLFVKNWLTGLTEDNLLVGTNWNGDLIGLEVEPIDLLNDIIEKINQL